MMRSLKRYLGGNGGTTSLSRSLAAVIAMLPLSSDELPSSASWTSAISAAAVRPQGRDLPRINRILVSSHVWRSETTTQHRLPPSVYCYYDDSIEEEVGASLVDTSGRDGFASRSACIGRRPATIAGVGAR
jgi:hypothetical protein